MNKTPQKQTRKLHPHDHEDLSWIPRNHGKKQDMAACACGPIAMEAERFLKPAASQLGPIDEVQNQERLCINKQVDSA